MRLTPHSVLVLVSILSLSYDSSLSAAPAIVHADQVISDGGTLQDAVDQTPDWGVLVLSNREYPLRAPLNLRGRKGMTIRSFGGGMPPFTHLDGPRLMVRFNAGRRPVIDTTGAMQLRLEGWRLEHLSTGFEPALVGLLLARDRSATSSAHHRISIAVDGRFHNAVFNVGSEENVWTGCGFVSRLPGGVAYRTSSWNSIGVDADFAGGPRIGGSGAISNALQTFRDCTFWNPQGGPEDQWIDNVAVVIEPRTQDYLFDRCTFVSRAPTRALILIEGGDDATFGVQRIEVVRPYCEAWGAAAWLEIAGRVEDVRLTGGRFNAAGKLVSDPQGLARRCTVDGIVLDKGEFGDAAPWVEQR
jgi:hypothetical protein